MFPPSKPCSCDICLAYCRRSGWWSVHEAKQAIEDGMANRMMLEAVPDFSFFVLSPAFKGNEGYFALDVYSHNWCTFFVCGRCELFGTSYQPAECRFCHHERKGLGEVCHRALMRDWKTNGAKRIVTYWFRLMSLGGLERAGTQKSN